MRWARTVPVRDRHLVSESTREAGLGFQLQPVHFVDQEDHRLRRPDRFEQGRARRNSSEKMSSSRSRQARRHGRRSVMASDRHRNRPPPAAPGCAAAASCNSIRTAPWTHRDLVALQADETTVGDARHRLGQLGLTRSCRSLDEHGLGQPVGQVHDTGDAVVGQVPDFGQTGAHVGDGLETGGPVRGNRAGSVCRCGGDRLLVGGAHPAPARPRAPRTSCR